VGDATWQQAIPHGLDPSLVNGHPSNKPKKHFFLNFILKIYLKIWLIWTGFITK
jgi:hypothetical protein